MPTFAEAEAALKARGYTDANVEEKLAQDILLAAFARSGRRAQLAIKGGVVMAALTGDIRRTTLDLDVDFVHRSIDDDSIRELVRDLDGVAGVAIDLVGDIVELRQQDYRGKRVFLSLRDETGDTIQAKLDIGVHALPGVEQVEMAFDVGTAAAEPAVLFANSPEQVFVEKLRSLLRLGPISNRGKDVFDMLFLAGRVDRARTLDLIDRCICRDPRMLETDLAGIVRRVRRTFADRNYTARLAHRRSNWLQIPTSEATSKLLAFLESLTPSPHADSEKGAKEPAP